MSTESFLKLVLCEFSRSIKTTTPLAPLLLRQSREERQGENGYFLLKIDVLNS